MSNINTTSSSDFPESNKGMNYETRCSDRVKILAWDGTGLVLYSKRLETGRFIWPAIQDGVITLSASQLSVLLDGLDWKKVAPRVVDRPLRAG
jgi:transposase